MASLRRFPSPGESTLDSKHEVSTCAAVLESNQELPAHSLEICVYSKSDRQTKNAVAHPDWHVHTQPPKSPIIEPSTVSTARIPRLSPPEISCSYTFVTRSGYTVLLQPFAHEWKATVQDNRFPGFDRIYSANVKFETGYSLEDLTKQGPSYQSRRVHFFPNKDQSLVYIGQLGLKGGGNNSSKGPPCNGCKKCWRCMTCNVRKCMNCLLYCSNCCGCYQRAMQAVQREQKEAEQRALAQQKEEERRAVLSKLDESLASASVAIKESSTNAVIISSSHHENVQNFDHDTSILSCPTACTNLTIDSESDSDSSSLSHRNEASLDESSKQNHTSEPCLVDLDSTKQDSNLFDKKLNNSKVRPALSNFGQSNLLSRILPSRTKSFLTKYTALLSREEKAHFKQTTGKYVKMKLPQVDTALQKSVIEYFSDAGILDSYVVQNYPVSEWIVQSLLKLLVSYEEDSFLGGFRTRWLNITELYSISEQETLVKSLTSNKDVHKLSLLNISDAIGLILFTGSCGYDIVCNSQDGWLLNLKTIWLETKLASLTQYSIEERSILGASLADMEWGVSMMDLFIKSVSREESLDAVVKLLSVIKLYQVSDDLVLTTLTTPSAQHGMSKARGWTLNISGHCLLRKLELPPKVTEAMTLPLYRLLKSSSSNQLMDQVINDHLSLIKAHPAEFTKVLELLYDYQVTEGICASAFLHLSEISAADWEHKIDEIVVSELFQDSQVFTIDQLVDEIAGESSAVTTDWLRSSYNSVAETYLSVSTVLQSLSGISEKMKNKPISDWKKEDVSLWAKHVKLSNTVLQSELIAGVKRAVELQHLISPRDTQILSLLTLLNPSEGMGRLAQINTGEGKSLVVAMLAAIHALQNKKVDVITTSTELSIPEVKKQKQFFDSLSITVAENSDIMTKQSAYECDVVYGIAGDFQADILRTEFLGHDIRGQRGFSIVIVDEVDSMLFDNRSHSVRLSEQTPGMVYLELPLVTIWNTMKWIARHLTTLDDQTFFIPEDFKRNGTEITLYSDEDWESLAVLVEDKRSFIIEKTRLHLDQLLRELNDEEKKHYEDYNNLNKQIEKLEETKSNTDCPIEKQKIEANFNSLLENLKNHEWKKNYDILKIPIHLRDFSRSQVPFWIESALNAAYGYRKGGHYTIQDGRIVPVQYNETGVLQSNMVWSDGLTQFLQLKEGLRMDPEGLATNFISNVGFFQRYGNSIYGLTGTLGEKSTKDYLNQIYNTDMIVISPYQRRTITDNAHSYYLCKELVPIVLSNETEWLRTVIARVLSHVRRQRSALVICKYIRQVEDLAKELRQQYDGKKIFTYTGEGTFVMQKIDSGQIIVATNIAGRGKDLETTLSVESCGGMYVAVTFLPETYRVEMQNVGRTARSGKKGMAQLIICDPITSDICFMKQNRLEKEIADSAKASNDTRKAQLQDFLFRDFCSLENEFLPSVRSCYLFSIWRNLKIAYQQFQDKELTVDKMAEYVNNKILNRKAEIQKLSLGALSSREASKITKEDKEKYYNQAVLLAESEQTVYELEFKNKVLGDFCNSQSHIPLELIHCLLENREFKPKSSVLAKKYDWGFYDRKALEDNWGFWLKAQHFETEDISLEEARERFNVAFATPSKARAQEDQLVFNPYFYVLKGNEYLVDRHLEPAIVCYDRAIKMDPDFSVNALYYKARALLSYDQNSGYRQECALKALNQAKEIIKSISRPALMTFSILLAQDGAKEQTSEHVQHQLNILSQQETFIDKACEIIESAQGNGYHVKLTTQLISETLNPDDQTDHIPAIREAAINGFIHLFTIEEVKPYPWLSILGLALIAIGQVAVGCLITACTGGALGSGLITEGVSDMITCVKAAIGGSFDWAEWGIQKAINLAVSIICAGITGIKNACRDVVTTAKDVTVGVVGTSKKGIQLAVQTVSTTLAKGVFKECLTAAAEWGIQKLFLENLENTLLEQVEKTIAEALLNNPVVLKAFELDINCKNNFWQNCFLEEGLSLLKEQKEHVGLYMMRETLSGVAKNKMPNSFSAFSQIAGTKKMIDDLTNYTNDFIKKFNAKIASHKSEIESAAKKMGLTEPHQIALEESPILSDTAEESLIVSDRPTGEEIFIVSDRPPEEESLIVTDTAGEGTVYTSKTKTVGDLAQTFYSALGPSSPLSLAREFKGQITSKLMNSVKGNVVNPTIGYGVNKVTSNIFSEIDRANNKLLNEVRTTRERRYFTNKLALAKDGRDKKNNVELNESARKGVERLKKDVPLDANDLGTLAATANAPIYVYDKETGNLVDVAGEGLPGKPCFVVYEKSKDSTPGHWVPKNANIEVHSSGSNTCLADAVFAQLDPDTKKELQNVNGLKKKMIERIKGHPQAANKAYETRDKLEKMAPRELRVGGKKRLNDTYPSHDNRIVTSPQLSTPLADLRNKLNECLEKSEKFDKLTQAQQLRYRKHAKSNPSFTSNEKTDHMTEAQQLKNKKHAKSNPSSNGKTDHMTEAQQLENKKHAKSNLSSNGKIDHMMGALHVKFNDNTTLSLTTVSGDSPLCDKVTVTDSPTYGVIEHEKVPLAWEKGGFKFVDPGDVKNNHVFDVFNRQSTKERYNRSCAGQKLLYELGEHMKKNPTLTINGKVQMRESWYTPKSKSKFTARQVVPMASCSHCEKILPIATGSLNSGLK